MFSSTFEAPHTELLARIPVGTTLYDVFAIGDPA